MSFSFKCPVCSEPLEADGRTLKCKNNHCFDVAKQGYVNLLQSQKSSKKRHGDDSLMVKARQEFLDAGYYGFLREKVIEMLLKYSCPDMTAADLGCGECYYTAEIYRVLKEQGINCEICGIDISRQALIYGAKRCGQLHLAVASTAELPLGDKSCDAVVSIFAPCSENEVHRVLKDGGVWIKAFPLERHLMGLKAAIYDEPYENKVSREAPDGFRVGDCCELKKVCTLEDSDKILSLFKMTPYYYKTSVENQNRISEKSILKTELEFGVYAYIKV